MIVSVWTNPEQGAFEDFRRYCPGQDRLFRSRNVADLMRHRRGLGLLEWNNPDLLTKFSLIARLPPPTWPANVVPFATGRKFIGRQPSLR